MPSPVLSWEDFTGMLTMQYELFTSFDQLELRHKVVLSSFKSLIDSARLLRKSTEALPRAIHIYSTYEDAFYIICCVAAGSPTVLGKVKEKNFFNEIGRLYKFLRTKHGKVQKLKLPSNLRPKQSKIVPENEIARWRLGADDSILPGDAKSGNTLHDEPESAVVQDNGLKHPRESTTEPEDRRSKSQRLSSPRATIEGEQVSDGDGISRSAGEEQRPLLRQQHSTRRESDASILGQQLPSFVVAESELQPPCNNGVQSVNRGNASKPQRLESHSADDVTERSERALDIHGDGTTKSTGEAQGSLLRQQCDSHQESDNAIHGDPPNSGHPFPTSPNLQVLLTPAETLYNSPYNDQRTLPTPRSPSSMKSIENARHNNQQNKYPEYSAHSVPHSTSVLSSTEMNQPLRQNTQNQLHTSQQNSQQQYCQQQYRQQYYHHYHPQFYPPSQHGSPSGPPTRDSTKQTKHIAEHSLQLNSGHLGPPNNSPVEWSPLKDVKCYEGLFFDSLKKVAGSMRLSRDPGFSNRLTVNEVFVDLPAAVLTLLVDEVGSCLVEKLCDYIQMNLEKGSVLHFQGWFHNTVGVVTASLDIPLPSGSIKIVFQNATFIALYSMMMTDVPDDSY